jgi:Cdc6-like AAA superfamily ATPase
MAKMSEADLRDLIARRRDASLKHLHDTRSSDRKEALQFYRGDNLTVYGNSGDGQSTVVSRDVLEAIESMLPSLVKPFIAGDEMVRFEPTGPEDEEPAKQATEYINYLFQNHNDAVRVVYDFTKDGLLYRSAWRRSFTRPSTTTLLETYSRASMKCRSGA